MFRANSLGNLSINDDFSMIDKWQVRPCENKNDSVEMHKYVHTKQW